MHGIVGIIYYSSITNIRHFRSLLLYSDLICLALLYRGRPKHITIHMDRLRPSKLVINDI
jgi:hypothetical protein